MTGWTIPCGGTTIGVPGYADGDGVRAPADRRSGSRDVDRLLGRTVGRTPASVQLLTRGKGGVRNPCSWDVEADLGILPRAGAVRGGSAKSAAAGLRDGSADAVRKGGVTDGTLGVERPKFGDPDRDGTWSLCVSSES